MGASYSRQDVADEISDGSIIDAVPLDAEFNALAAFAAASTGHTHDGTAGEGGPVAIVGPAQDVVITSSVVRPKTDDTIDLGQSDKRFKDGYFSGDVYFNGITTTTPSSLEGLILTANGSSNNPAMYFEGDPNTGWYKTSADTWSFTAEDQTILSLSNAGLNVSFGHLSVSSSALFVGNGSGLTSLDASKLTVGSVPTNRLSGNYTSVSGVGTLSSGSITTGFGNINIGSNVFTGNGSGLTNIQASDLTGIIPSARISGNYVDFDIITASGVITSGSVMRSDEFQGNDGDAADPTYTFSGDTNTGMYLSSADQISWSSGGVQKLVLGDNLQIINGNISISGTGTFSGQGTSITDLNATQLTSGTVPNARVVGAYTGFTNIAASGFVDADEFRGADGTAADPSFTFTSDLDTGIYSSAAGAMAFSSNGTAVMVVGSTGITVTGGGHFSGDGSGLTDLVATQLTSGTTPIGRYGTTSAFKDWVLARIADETTQASGTFAFATLNGTNAVAYLSTITVGGGVTLTTAAATDASGTALSGTWRCLGNVKASGGTNERTTMWLKQ